jgi:hypothetical protein
MFILSIDNAKLSKNVTLTWHDIQFNKYYNHYFCRQWLKWSNTLHFHVVNLVSIPLSMKENYNVAHFLAMLLFILVHHSVLLFLLQSCAAHFLYFLFSCELCFFKSWPFSCFSYLTSMPENDPSVLHRLLHSGLQVNKIAAVQIRCTNLPRLIATVQKVSRAQSPLRWYALANSSSSFPTVTYQ